ncbi:MAG: hypothetical protein U0X91_27220 [Spirosomataceae bacterium]
MKSSVFQSGYTIVGAGIVVSLLLYGTTLFSELLQKISVEISQYEAWLSSGILR